MAWRAPVFRKQAPRPKNRSNWDRRTPRQQRGLGRDHEKMRERVLDEEPFCRACQEAGRISLTTVADHILNRAAGGTNERSNYQGLCDDCHKLKTAQESGRGRRRRQDHE